jgi:hypothetical protein
MVGSTTLESTIASLGLARSPIPTVPANRWAAVAEEARAALLPLVVSGAFSSAIDPPWMPSRFSEHYAAHGVNVVTNLPNHGVPYRERSNAHQRTMTMAEFVSLLDTGEVCYLNQAPLRDYPLFAAALDLAPLRLGRLHSLNVWIGSRTRSGLHFDNADNFFGQMYGTKRALLVAPKHSKYLYPFADNPSKSQIDPERPDLKTFPSFQKCDVWECELHPGDALYIPRGWWHYIVADDISVSINCWHGDSLTNTELTKLFFAGGPRVVVQAARDFVWHGVLRRPYQGRLFSPPSPGVAAYRRLLSSIK